MIPLALGPWSCSLNAKDMVYLCLCFQMTDLIHIVVSACNNASNNTVYSYPILSLLYNFHLSLLSFCQPVTHWQVRSRHLICVKYTKLVQVATQIRGKPTINAYHFIIFQPKPRVDATIGA